MSGISRRRFVNYSTIGVANLSFIVKGLSKMTLKKNILLRLGGPIFTEVSHDPPLWVRVHRDWGYSAAYCPVKADAPIELIRSFVNEAKRSNLIIAEVGAWSNPINPDEEERKKAIAHCVEQLELAERINARCCVNIAGSRNKEKWDGAHPDNLTQETFDLIVETTQKIIDAVNPKRTYFTLETMPWIFPNSIDSYVNLIQKINRKRFAVHFDPVNLMNSPERYFNNGAIIKEAFKKLGSYIKSCHGKDTILDQRLTTHLSETDPGLGNLDYSIYLRELSKLPDVPLMLEHMKEPEQYINAVKYVNGVASDNGLDLLKI